MWPDGRIKSIPFSSNVAKNVDTTVFTLKVMLLKKPKQFSKYLGYFCNKICRQELSKIAQSGHSATIYQIRSIVWTSLLHLKSEIWKKKRFTVLASVPLMSLIHNQCDQIWRNFATLAKHINAWAKFDDLFSIWQHFEPTFWQKFYPIRRIFIVVNGKMLNNYQAIWSLWFIINH